MRLMDGARSRMRNATVSRKADPSLRPAPAKLRPEKKKRGTPFGMTRDFPFAAKCEAAAYLGGGKRKWLVISGEWLEKPSKDAGERSRSLYSYGL
jgi:hypothetical protein